MNLTITGHQLEVTEALRSYARTKLAKLAVNFDQVLDAHAIIGAHKHEQYAEATIHLPGKTVFAKADGLDAYAAIDGLVDKLDRQLVRYKERSHEHRGPVADSLGI